MSDLTHFLAFYSSVGYSIQSCTDNGGYGTDDRTVFVVQEDDGTRAYINGGYFCFYTVAVFDKSGKFLEQGSYE